MPATKKWEKRFARPVSDTIFYTCLYRFSSSKTNTLNGWFVFPLSYAIKFLRMYQRTCT